MAQILPPLKPIPIKDRLSVLYALPLTQWQMDELDRRLAELEADPDSGATLEEVFAIGR